MDSESAPQSRRSALSTFLWLFLTFLLIYFLFASFSTSPSYRGVEEVPYSNIHSMLHGNTSVMYYLPDCPHCQEQMPLYRHLSDTMPRVNFLAVNASENAIPSSENIMGFPTIKIFKDKKLSGNILGKQTGVTLKEKIINAIKNSDDPGILAKIAKALTKKKTTTPPPAKVKTPKTAAKSEDSEKSSTQKK
jgi:thiol-disulfide isomerase/thioredoxin